MSWGFLTKMLFSGHDADSFFSLLSGDANLTDEQIAKLPFALYRQGYEYYWKTHAHPNSTFKYTTSSLLDLMNSEITTY